MRPYYDEGGVTLYHGDCREVLPTLGSIDLVVTDPPFFLPAEISQSRRAWPRSIGNLAVMHGYFADTFAMLAASMNRTGAVYVFADSTSAIVFGAGLYPAVDRLHMLVWDKTVGGLGNGWRHSHELVLHGAFRETVYEPGFRKDVIAARTVPTEERGHPSEKAPAVIAALLCAHPPRVAVDPFAGGGGILYAAKLLGRRAIGIEIEERYCEVAAKRLAQGVLDFGPTAREAS